MLKPCGDSRGKFSKTWCKVCVKARGVFLFSFSPAASFSFFPFPSSPPSVPLSSFACRLSDCLAQLLRTQLIYHCLSLAQFLNVNWLKRPGFIFMPLVLLLRPSCMDWHLRMVALPRAMGSGSAPSPVLFTVVPSMLTPVTKSGRSHTGAARVLTGLTLGGWTTKNTGPARAHSAIWKSSGQLQVSRLLLPRLGR